MCIYYVLIISLLLSPFAQAESSGSVLFIDSKTHQYFRAQESNEVAEGNSISLTEVSAAVSVLLGVAPPASLSADGSSKLNKVLMPNPFDRPRAVFMLEVTGVDDSHKARLMNDANNANLRNTLRRNVFPHSEKADIQLSDEDEISVVSLDGPLVDCTNTEMIEFAHSLGGSYVSDNSKVLNGQLSIPLENGVDINLHMSKKADREFALSLMALTHNIRKTLGLHQEISQRTQNRAELIMGYFNGMKALQEEYGAEGVAEQGMKVLLSAVSKIFDSLQTAYNGQIVGVIFFNDRPTPESGATLNVMSTSGTSHRLLAEAQEPSDIIHIAEVMLVRKILAWITGIILLIATLLGIYFLLNMPITRDTLLYSNVKLD